MYRRTQKSLIPALPLLALAALIWAQPASAEERACRIDSVIGEATIRGAVGERAAASGAELAEADILITGSGARVGILCSDQIALTIGPDTELELGALVGEIGERRNVFVSLNRGIARFLAPIRNWGMFSVEAPSAIASVRSTEWVVLTEAGASSVLVLDGSVAVKAKGVGGAVLPAGSGIDVDADGKVTKVGKWGPKRVAKVKEVLGLD